MRPDMTREEAEKYVDEKLERHGAVPLERDRNPAVFALLRERLIAYAMSPPSEDEMRLVCERIFNNPSI